jgi:two-component system phosphate regulon sensor histidine kinase PhoR
VVLDGETIGSVVGFRDVSREKAVEELKEDFLSLATHQLRSPLVTMRWTFESLFENYEKETPESLKRKLDTIYQNNQHMISLVNDILSVSRLNQNRLLQQKQPGNLIKVLENTLVQLAPETERRQIKFEMQIEDESLKTQLFNIDASLLSHCIENVAENAVKYSKLGGVIQIKVSRTGDKVCIAVSDNGVGVPEVDKAHVFEKFYRGQNVSQMDVLGSGLGLFVVKSIIENWKGTITLASKENEGTTVTMCVPFELV